MRINPDWPLLARARQLDIPAEQMTKIAPALDRLADDFRPLLARLTPADEPAVIFNPTPGETA